MMFEMVENYIPGRWPNLKFKIVFAKIVNNMKTTKRRVGERASIGSIAEDAPRSTDV